MRDYFGKTAPQHIESRKLYTEARSDVAGVLGYMKQAMLNGSISSAEASKFLHEAIAKSEASSSVFFQYVQKNSPSATSKPGGGTIGAIAEVVQIVVEILKAWGASEGVKASIDEARRKAAASMEADLMWRAWTDLPSTEPKSSGK